MVPASGTVAGRKELRSAGRPLGRGLHHGRNVDQIPNNAGKQRAATTDVDLAAVRFDHAGSVARRGEPGVVQDDGLAAAAEEEGEGKTETVHEGPVRLRPARQAAGPGSVQTCGFGHGSES